jgi:hypothetical protein
MRSNALPITISKSKYMAGVQCLKRLYLLVHSPELGTGKSAADFALMDQGRQVGKLAQQLFPGGVEVRSGDPAEAIRITRELVDNPEVGAIFEAAFQDENLLVRVDVLQRRRDGRWRLVEVKSTADLKDHHLDDVAIQYRVVSRCGLDIASVALAHVNRKYVFQGGKIDARQFFRIRNLTRRVGRLQPKLTFQLRSEFRVLAMRTAPDLPVGTHCKTPVICEFFDHCNPQRPNDHVGYLPRIQASAVEELGEMGVESIRDIPDDFPLNERQRRACTSVQTGEPWFAPELRQALSSLSYPLFFMDFETVNPAIPSTRACTRSTIFRSNGAYTSRDSLTQDWSTSNSYPIETIHVASSSVRFAMRWRRAAALSCTTPLSSHNASPSLRHGCRSLRGGLREFRLVFGTCSLLFGTTYIIQHSPDRTR